ncbi:DUF2442 domain-containing protein [Glaciimonas sp. GG7]
MTTLTQTHTDTRVKSVTIDADRISVELMDGREIAVPLVWFPRLADATQEQRSHWQIAGGGYGIHWPDVDEDLSTEGLLRGAPAITPIAH